MKVTRNSILFQRRSFQIGPARCAMGFGYDPKSNDYTIVNVASYDEEVYEQRLVHSPPNAEVYTLGTDFLETEITFGHSFFKCT